MDRRSFLTALGLGGAALGGAVVGSAARAVADDRTEQSNREDGAYAVGPRGHQDVLWSVETEEKVAALTFDDGPNPSFTPRVLEILAAAGVPATFFVIGRLAADSPDLSRRLVAAGHEIGNHTWSHLSAPTLTDQRTVDEIDRSTESITALVGTAPAWYRPPRGMLTGAGVRRAHELGQSVAMWSLDRGPTVDIDTKGVRDWMVAHIHPGAIIDLHDGVGSSSFNGPSGYAADLVRRRNTEIEALPEVIAGWQAAGYRLVTLSELAGHQPRSGG